MRSKRGRVRRVALILASAGAMLFATRGVLMAHAMLIRSDPRAGSHLATSPARVRLLFSEELEPTLARLSLVAGDGRVVTLAASADPHDVNALVAPIATLAAGTYRVRWRVISADGHPVQGSFLFSVGSDSAAVGAVPPDIPDLVTATWGPSAVGAPLVPALLRGLALGGLMALAGFLYFLTTARHVEPPPRVVTRVARGLAIATPVLFLLQLATWLINASPDHSLTGDWISAALRSNVGMIESARVVLVVLVPWALVLMRRARFALVLAALALCLSGASGHPWAMHPAWSVPAKAVHLLAGALWLGGLLWLFVCLARDSGVRSREAARVSSAAALAVIAIVLSGIVQACFTLSAPIDLVRSAYGLVMLAKVAGLGVLLAFGAHHRYRVLPRLEADAATPGRLAVTLRREIVVFALVTLLGAFLAYLPTPAPAMHMPAMPMPTSTDDSQ